MDCIRSQKNLNIPNLLTLFRIALLPLIVRRFLMDDLRGALNLYIMAMISDAVDGMVARRFNQITVLGKLLDPVADKLSLLTLITLFVADGQIPTWILAALVLKECILIGGSALALYRGIVVHALPIGKLTTASFVLSMVLRFKGWRIAADWTMNLSLALSAAALIWYAVVVVKKLHAPALCET